MDLCHYISHTFHHTRGLGFEKSEVTVKKVPWFLEDEEGDLEEMRVVGPKNLSELDCCCV